MHKLKSSKICITVKTISQLLNGAKHCYEKTVPVRCFVLNEGGVHEINVSVKLTLPSMFKYGIHASELISSYFVIRVIVPGKRY